jgi:hypothetical protein
LRLLHRGGCWLGICRAEEFNRRKQRQRRSGWDSGSPPFSRTESQRDSRPKPRVARHELPWEI